MTVMLKVKEVSVCKMIAWIRICLKIQKVEDINGYVSDGELSKDSGKYIRKSFMTYQEYLDLEITNGILHGSLIYQ